MFRYRVLSDYIHHALQEARYETLSDRTVAGTISGCKGLIALEASVPECQETLQRLLESWIVLGFKTGRPLPVIHGIDLNEEPHYENLYSL